MAVHGTAAEGSEFLVRGGTRRAMARITAEQLQERLGTELRSPPFAGVTSVRTLRRLIRDRDPAFAELQDAAVKTWLTKYYTPVGAVRVESAEELEEQYGGRVRAVGVDGVSAFLFCKALREGSPSVIVSDTVAKQWLRRFGGQEKLRDVQLAGHLECWFGEAIRGDPEARALGPQELRVWLARVCKASASVRTCQH